MQCYILDQDLEPVPVSPLEFGEWFEQNDEARRVALTEVGEAKVSTVFLGIDHQFGDREPLLYETMIFGGKFDGNQWRTPTRAKAIDAHGFAVAVAQQTESQYGQDE